MSNNDSILIDDLLKQIDQKKKPYIAPEDIERYSCALTDDGRHADAFKMMNYGLECYPDNPKILILKVMILVNNQLFDEAYSTIKMLKSRGIDNAAMEVGIGWYYLRQERVGEALKAFNSALKKCSSTGERSIMLYNIAFNLNGGGFFNEAIPYWEEYKKYVVEDNPDLSNLAYAYSQIGKNDKAISLYIKILRRHSSNWQIWYGLSMAYLSNGNEEKALEACNKVLSINPFASRVYYNMGVIYFRNYEHQKTIDSMTEYISLTADVEPDTYVSLGASWYELKNYEEATKNLKKACELMPDSATPYYYLGMTQLDDGDAEGALESYKKAAELDPVEPTYLFSVAEVYDSMGKSKKTAEYLNRGLALAPNEIHAWCELYRIEALEQGPFFEHDDFLKKQRKKHGDVTALKMLEAYFDWTFLNRKDEALGLIDEIYYESYDVLSDAMQNDMLSEMFKKKEIKQLLAKKGIKV
ncbi:MAG: tetratricopeptide repeat protein [Bacteroidales bacterium]|nr:tetratricopeptide repeat protein [Bacteroidales bacterium]